MKKTAAAVAEEEKIEDKEAVSEPKIKVRKVTIKSISPILMHAYPLVPIEALEKKTPAEQAELVSYRDSDTKELYVPGVAIQRCFISAATYSKGKGRASLQRQAAACMLVSPERVGLGVTEYKIDSRAVVVPATKGRIIRHRPRLDDWELTFELEWDSTLLSEEQVRKIVDNAGSHVGLLDFRPEKKGPFGRFLVTLWTAQL